MKKYDVFGIGNALVDMEFLVEDDWLLKMNIEKGVMTLVDENRQHELLNNLDPFTAKKFCGGSAANSMIAISQFGGKSFYTCKVANDPLGEFYFEDLLREGVDTNMSSNRAKGQTGKCMVFITKDADRTMNTYLGDSERLSVAEVSEKDLLASEFVYLEGYLASSKSAREAAILTRKLAKKHGIKVSLTLSDLGMVRHFRSQLLAMIEEGVDLLFCNQDEAMEFAESSNLEVVLNKVKQVAKTFAITRGAQGAIVFDGEKFHQVEAPKVSPIDTTGAGDVFAGSFLYAITHGSDYYSAGKLACKAASKLVTQYGSRLNREQVRNLGALS